MDTRIATACAEHGGPETIAKDLTRALRGSLGAREPVLVMLFASINQPLQAIQTLVAGEFSKAVVMGSSTAGEFTGEGDTQGAVVAWALAGDFAVRARMAIGLRSRLEEAVAEAVADLAEPMEGYPHRTAFVLLDSMAGNAEEATLLTSALLGSEIRLAGGAAADDLVMQGALVGLGDRVVTDSLCVAVLHGKSSIGIGVCHGHVPLSGPLVVTRSQGNVVYELNGRPAWDVWLEETAGRMQELGIDPASLHVRENMVDFLNRFEAGLKLGSEYKVRVPMLRGEDGHSLGFACGIPEKTVLRVMESIDERQIASAREAVRRSRENLGGHEIAGALIFDCSCRKSILRHNFGKAVAAMRDELSGAPLAGFETYGEIAMEVGEMSGFHNTTTVAVTFAK